MTEPDSAELELPLDQRFDREALKQANQLAESFDLRECLHLKQYGFKGDEDEDEDEPTIELPYVMGKRGERAHVSIDELTEAIRDWLREALPAKIFNQLLAAHLKQANPNVDVTKLL